jgi:glycosyltransferase involved in cell wall biosynthesis
MNTSVAIDASRAFVSARTGVEEYTYQLIKALRDPLANVSVVLYVRCAAQDTHDARIWVEKNFYTLPDAWTVVGIAEQRGWTQIALAWRLWRDRPDVLLVPGSALPWLHPRRTISVVHGLEYERVPQAYHPWTRITMRIMMRLSCLWAWRIIAVSHNTRRDLMQLYHVDAAKITVIHEGINVAPQEDIGSCREAVRVIAEGSVPYFLSIGRREIRKNLVHVIEAFDRYKKDSGDPHRLVLVGGAGYGAQTVSAAIARSPYADQILQLGYVTTQEKWYLLRHACACVFVTLYEGFGLPVLEAQSVDVAVIVSSVASLPEVAGRDALMADPTDVPAIAHALSCVAHDTALRRAIITGGRANIRRFGWNICAKEVASLIQNS